MHEDMRGVLIYSIVAFMISFGAALLFGRIMGVCLLICFGILDYAIIRVNSNSDVDGGGNA